MSQPAAVVETKPHGNHIVVRISGELDVFNAATMTSEIEAAIPTEAYGAVIDLTGVGFLDSTAIRKLFGLASRLTERRQRLVIVTPEGSTVRRTLQLVEFSRAAPMHATLEDALSSLGTGDNGS
ncbi:MAG: STAS domain-containing protein [Actinomycetota bacterium]|nr:STAS domain-containing protein [Actinomycetota bacterium]